MSPLSWQNLIFLVPLAVGALLLLSSALGLASSDVGADHHVDVGTETDLETEVDADAEVDPGDAEGGAVHAEADSPDAAPGLLALLGFGRVPLSLLLMVGLVLFGGSGLCLNLLLAPLLHLPAVYGSVSVVAATFVTLAGTGLVARAVSRLLPSVESYATERGELVGELGVAELPIDERFGMAHVCDSTGSLMQIRCRVEGDGRAIKKGEAILVIDYDSSRDEYVVERSPV